MRPFFLDWKAVRDKILAPMDKSAADPGAPLEVDARNMFKLLVEPWWHVVDQGGAGRKRELVLIPTDELYRVPLHVGLLGNGMPLCSAMPTVYSVSASAFLYRGRYLLRRQHLHETDDLCAVLYRDERVSCGELVGLDWPQECFFIAGSPPKGIGRHNHLGSADWKALDMISHREPEFFLYSGHGVYYPQFGVLGPALVLQDDLMTQYDVALRLRLPHNALTFLGACVSGQGGNIGGGEVSGFLRAFMAAGSGALGVTLWPVLDDSIGSTVRHILRMAQAAAATRHPFDVVQACFEYCQQVCDAISDPAERIEACPIALYL